MYRFLTVFALLFSLLSPEIALAGSNLKIKESTPWMGIGPNTWTKKLTWESGLQETLTLTDDRGVLRFVAQSTCMFRKERVVTYVWTGKDQYAEGVGCNEVFRRIPVRRWEEATKNLPSPP